MLFPMLNYTFTILLLYQILNNESHMQSIKFQSKFGHIFKKQSTVYYN